MLSMTDTAGQEKYRSITSSYIRGNHIIGLVYDVTKRQTLDNLLTYWAPLVEKFVDPLHLPTIIWIANKCDKYDTKNPVSLSDILSEDSDRINTYCSDMKNSMWHTPMFFCMSATLGLNYTGMKEFLGYLSGIFAQIPSKARPIQSYDNMLKNNLSTTIQGPVSQSVCLC